MRVSWILSLIFARCVSCLVGNQDGFETKVFDAIDQVQGAYQAIADGRLPPPIQRAGPTHLWTPWIEHSVLPAKNG